MREIIYLDQDGIDELVQRPNAFNRSDYNSLRSLQDGVISEITYPDKIIRRKYQ